MKIESRSTRESLELTVVRYQFAGGDNEYDLNWLIVRGLVVASDRSWKFEDPCLLTSEAVSLGSWLRHVTNPHADFEKLTFLEPNLTFDVAARTDDSVTVRTYFDLEARPSDLADADEDECWIDLEVATDDLVNAAQTWLTDLEEFPTRS